MIRRNIVWHAVVSACLFGFMAPAIARAQALGAFAWQLQPYCNVLSVHVAAGPDGVFRLEGYDDQCGTPQRAPAVGVATLNPDGTIGVGVHVVTAPEGRALAIDARIAPDTGSGTWRDSTGNTGTFALGARVGGAPRPAPTVPAAAIASGAITAQHLAPGVIGTVAQSRVTGLCTNGQALRGVNPDGSVACTVAAHSLGGGVPQYGRNPSIAIPASGKPWIAHYDGGAQRLVLTRCGDTACASGNLTDVVSGAPAGAGTYAALAVGTDGLAVVAFYDAAATRLLVTHCGDAVCRAGSVTTPIAPSAAVGEFVAIAIGADGLPVISYYDRTKRTISVTHCGVITCATGNVTTTPDPTMNDVGWYSSIAIGVDGLPVVSYYDATAGALRVTHCGAVDCRGGNTSTQVDALAGQDLGSFSSIAIGRDGLPIVAHTQSKSGLRVTHCGNAACTAGTVSTTLTALTEGLGMYPSVAIGADGLAVIAQGGSSTDALFVSHCENAACTGARTSRVDPLDTANGFDPSLAIGVDGLPIVAHYIKSGGGLRVTKCGTATCQ